ncbi:Gfo/Idh/MocA family protein [Heyndrickxia ginsengihumi]|uniref:Gfo/Idh/MocA family protein n=1 Tax=Heyndrickxia ginsengihumi TaxID=363870 RepID=UPI00203A775A|nr:Gfo/Idh/MocA family oxidoreductase [Heyndrickxia ginsengihumi]MCM3024964.1 Gfo/Idh/MocA family oxidoreductase [Heyndrickxia ginsengihumi]
MKFATVGTGWITSAFIDAAQHSGKLSLHSVYSRSKEKAEQLASKYHVSSIFTDLDKMAKSEEFRVVYIASPNSLHFEQVLAFLKNKKHVICEKPIFSNIAEFEFAYKVAEENGVYLFEAMRNIHYPNALLLKKNINALGQIRSAMFQYIQYSSRYDAFLAGQEPNVFSRNFSGGALVDLGVYPLSLAVFLFGKPIDSHYYPVLLRNGVDGAGTLVLKYNDFNITILCSKISHSYIQSEIHGEKGSIVIDSVSEINHTEFHDHHTKTTSVLSTSQLEQNMAYEIDSFVEIIERNDLQAYASLKQLSADVLSITETSRRQNDIVFKSEQK